MRIANYGGNYNNYANNNEILKENASSNPFQYTNNTGTQKAKTTKPNKEYEALNKLLEESAKSASLLRESSEKLSETGKDSLFAKAIASGDTKELLSEIKKFVEQYNKMVAGMKEVGGTENTAYAKELEQYFQDNKEMMEAAGIRLNKDGSIALDEKKLLEAKPEELAKIFQGSTSFASRVSIKSIYIEANMIKSQQKNTLMDELEMYNNYTAKSKRMSEPHRNYLK